RSAAHAGVPLEAPRRSPDLGERTARTSRLPRARLVDFLLVCAGPGEAAWVASLDRAEHSNALRMAYCLLIKRWLDLALASLLLLGLVPLLLVVAAVLRLQSAEPVIFRQTRVGRHGRPFTLLKFRTMMPDRRTRKRPFTGRDRRLRH